jgi:2-succinyl-6-hydroxy-2,4-cyclohexadiene-1-carboxylate synthase
VILAHETTGSGTPAAFVHGFTQTRRSWAPLLALMPGIEATVIDAPGHGGSPDGARSLTQSGDDIAETMRAGILVGYSMGARMALHAALDHPDIVSGLVLISGTAGIEDAADRAARRAADDALAARIEEAGTAAFVDEWLANPMFSGLSPAMAMREERLRNTPRGLADSLRSAGAGTQDDLWPRLGSLEMPTLIITGTRDTKFTVIGERMHRAVAGSTWEQVDGAGHTVHLEAPAAVAGILLAWLLSAAPG